MGVCIGAGFPNFVMYWLQINLLELGGFSYIIIFKYIVYGALNWKKINEIKQNTIIKQDDKEVVKYSKYVSD